MMKRTVRQIAEMSGGRCVKSEWETIAVSGVSTDTRAIRRQLVRSAYWREV